MTAAPAKPVWCWATGSSAPVRVGTCSLDPGGPSMHVDIADRAGLPAPWPVPAAHRFHRLDDGLPSLPLLRLVLAAGPDGFGRRMLEDTVGRTIDSALDRLELAAGDAVGAIAVCDDIRAKALHRPPGSDRLLRVLGQANGRRPIADVVLEVTSSGGTALHGDTPKLTVLHHGQAWIAKLPRSPACSPRLLREFVGMRLARMAGLHVADVDLASVGDHVVLLVRRFDRARAADGGTLRLPSVGADHLLASAAAAGPGRGLTYRDVADVLADSCDGPGVDRAAIRAQVWHRWAFSAVLGSGGDHAGRHGLVNRGQGWVLAPTFAIAPHPQFTGVLPLDPVDAGAGGAMVGRLVSGSPGFGVPPEAAQAAIRRYAELIERHWEALVRGCGQPLSRAPAIVPQWLVS